MQTTEQAGPETLLSVPVPDEAARATQALAYKNQALVAALMGKFGLQQDEAEELFLDVLKFMCLEGVYRSRPSPTAVIDAAWETFVLQTEEYTRYCQEMFGRYIHHRPIGHERGVLLLCTTYMDARKRFGDLGPNWEWTAPQDSFCTAVS